MSNLNFSSNKQKIQEGLSKRLNGVTFPGENSGFTLVDGFINLPLQAELTGGLVVGGYSLPMIAIVGNTTGKVYCFALKAILPELES